MLADTHAFGDGRVYPHAKKIYRRHVVFSDHTQAGDLLIAACGAAGLMQVARSVDIPQPHRGADPVDFIDALSVALQRHCMELAVPHGAADTDQQWLVAWQGGIYTFTAYDVHPKGSGEFEAIGAGGYFALAALETMKLHDLLWANPERALLDAGDITAKWCFLVEPPWQIEKLSA